MSEKVRIELHEDFWMEAVAEGDTFYPGICVRFCDGREILVELPNPEEKDTSSLPIQIYGYLPGQDEPENHWTMGNGPVIW